METATWWSGLTSLYGAVGDALRQSLSEQGSPPPVLCHISHMYPMGASLYYTVGAAQLEDPIEQWRRAKAAASDAIVEAGGTITHHHGVGVDHRSWVRARDRTDRSAGNAGGQGDVRSGRHHEPGRDSASAVAVEPPPSGAATYLNAARRSSDLEDLAGGDPVDVLVVGGGVTGAGVALDAVTRGLSVALVERGDLASGTSGLSSKLAHGGLRYPGPPPVRRRLGACP